MKLYVFQNELLIVGHKPTIPPRQYFLLLYTVTLNRKF